MLREVLFKVVVEEFIALFFGGLKSEILGSVRRVGFNIEDIVLLTACDKSN